MSHSAPTDDDSGYLNDTVLTQTGESTKLPSRTHQPPPTLAPGESNAPPTKAYCGTTILPEELILEILSRVPVKFLLQFRCVCKSWKSLLSDPHFVRKHLQTANYRLMMFVSESESKLDFNMDGAITCSVQSLLNNPSVSVDSPFRIVTQFRVVESCNGLLCLVFRADESRFLCLWNPSTRRISEPLLLEWEEGMFEIMLGFGYDHLSDNYKVVTALCSQATKTVVKVYTSGSNHWRQIQSFPHRPDRQYDGSGKFLCGTLNWLACFQINSLQNAPVGRSVMSFDLGKETFREILLPDCDNGDYPNLGVSKDCLCYSYVYKRDYFVVWLMKDYGVDESWIKLVTIPFRDQGILVSIYYPKPLFVSENDEILIGNNYEELLLYKPRGNALNYCKIKGHEMVLRPTVYVESLISPFI